MDHATAIPDLDKGNKKQATPWIMDHGPCYTHPRPRKEQKKKKLRLGSWTMDHATSTPDLGKGNKKQATHWITDHATPI